MLYLSVKKDYACLKKLKQAQRGRGEITMTAKLTAFEIKLVNAMRSNEYNDAIEDPTWTFTAIDNSGIPAKQVRGVIASLVKKGLIFAEIGEKKVGDEDTIGFSEAGKKLFDKADGLECPWGGKPLLKEVEATEPKAKEEVKTEVLKPAKVKGELTIVAFTNMLIGTFAVTKQTTKTVTVTTAKGVELTFDKKTKLQTNAKNPKFANKFL